MAVYIPTELARRFCKINDVMIGRYGPPVFQILRGLEGAYNVALMKAYPKDSNKLDNIFLYYLLQEESIQNAVIEQSQRSAGQTGVDKDFIENRIIFLPDIISQRRIVTEIERQFAIVEKAKQTATEQLAAARALNAAYLREVFEGNEWEQIRLGDIGDVCMCKRIFKDQTKPTGDIPFYKIGTFGGKADAFISQSIYDTYKSQFPFPKKGDVLISASGTLGRTVVYDGEPAYFQDSNIVWIDNDESRVLNRYLYHIYATNPWTGIGGATIARLYNDNIREAKILTPHIDKQHRVVEYLETSYVRVNNIISVLQSQLDTINAMPAAILRQAFSGQM
jgi:type I restriction enzyme S subunit